MKSCAALRVICVSLVIAAATPAQANLLTNGSFELGAFVNQGNDTMSLGAGSTVITGWTVITDTTAWMPPTRSASPSAGPRCP
mgnify:CR=1 FL=1